MRNDKSNPGRKYIVPPKLYTAYGKTKSLTKWSKDPRCMCAYRTLRLRVQQLGWPLEKSLSEPVRKCLTKRQRKELELKKKQKVHGCPVSAWGITMSLIDWSKQKYVTVSVATLSRRINRDKWPPEKALMTPPHKRYKSLMSEPTSSKSPWDMSLGEYTRHCLKKEAPRLKKD